MQDDIIQHGSETPAILYGPVIYGPIEYSNPVGDLMRALSLAQAEMANPEHDSTNYYTKGYASMAAVRNAVLPSLTKHGVAVTQFPDFSEGMAGCITILWYGEQYLRSRVACRVVKTSTEWKDRVKTSVLVPVAELTHQDFTGLFSYLRRIALKAIAGIADEGDEADEKVTRRRGEETPTDKAETMPTDKAETTPETPRSARPAPSRPRPEPEYRATGGRSFRLTAAEASEHRAEMARLDLLDEVAQLYQETIQPLKHAGMHKAIFYHCFGIDKPELIKAQSLETFEAGIALYRHLTAHLGTWERRLPPDDWIGEQQRRLATEAAPTASVPEGVDPTTGEDSRATPMGRLTEEERREQQERDATALLEHAAHAS